MAVIINNDNRYVVVNEADIGKSREDLLRDLLYEAWGTRFPADKVKFGKPSELDQRPQDLFDPNSFIPIKVDVQFDRRFTAPEAGIMYRRLSLSDYVKNVDFTAVKPEFYPFRISDLLDQINSFLPYALNMDDLVEYEYSTADQWRDGIRLDPLPESYVWIKGEKVFIDTTAINHENLLSQHTLDGFNIYRPEGAPIPIPGFAVHSGGCTELNCPICRPSDSGASGEVDPRARGYINMVNRGTNTAFKQPGESDPVAPGAADYLNTPADGIPESGSGIQLPAECGQPSGETTPVDKSNDPAYRVSYGATPTATAECAEASATQPAYPGGTASTSDCGCS